MAEEQQKIDIIGCGAGTPSGLSEQTARSIKNAQILIGPAQLLETFAAPGQQTVCADTDAELLEAAKEASEENCAVLLFGDPAYSPAAWTLRAHFGTKAAFFNGISSLSLICSRIGIAAEKVRCLESSRDGSDLLYQISRSRYSCLLPETHLPAGEVLALLRASELGMLEAYCAVHLGQEGEVLRHGPVSELHEEDYPPNTVLLFSNPDWARYTTIGLPDESFFRGTVPMTKFEVRNIASSKLEISATDIIYDIGAGTGSVSIELARRAYDGKVYAVERLPEALYLLNKNRRHLRAFNMEITAGEAPEILASLPAPDKIFIGGSGGRIDEIIRVVLSRNPRVLICATAATLETLAAARQAFSACNCHTEVIQTNAARLVPRGNAFSMFEAINPVFVLVGRPATTPG